MNLFIQQIVDDLKEFSSELLAPGLNSAQQVTTNMGTVASTSALLHAIDHLTGLIPRLLAELETAENTHKFQVHYYASPKRAKLSRRSSDYQFDKNRKLMPARWLSILPVTEVDTRPLRWLLHLIDLQQQELENILDRNTKYIDDSLLNQQGYSDYASNDRITLLNMRYRLYEAQTKLEHARNKLMRRVQHKFVANAALPYPFPRSQAWTQLRVYAQQLTHPKDYLPNHLHHLLYGTVEIADTPYLYQRWCGVKLLRALEDLGWYSYSDPVGALFLGGEIKLYKAGVETSLWVEPRFSRHQVHPSGFACKVEETHPDYMLVTSGPCGVDAFILDPTTTIDPTIRRGKGRYLNTVETIAMTTLAGVPVVRNPLRAWSAAPLHSFHCELDDAEGRTGTIPMHPLDWSDKPLREWLGDIDQYALAWGKYMQEFA
jgi:hypothetical protein